MSNWSQHSQLQLEMSNGSKYSILNSNNIVHNVLFSLDVCGITIEYNDSHDRIVSQVNNIGHTNLLKLQQRSSFICLNSHTHRQIIMLQHHRQLI